MAINNSSQNENDYENDHDNDIPEFALKIEESRKQLPREAKNKKIKK